MRALQYSLVLALSISLLAGFTPHAFAGEFTPGCDLAEADTFFPPSGASPGTPQPSQCIENINNESWFVGFPNDRVVISFVPGAGPWVKFLDVPFGVSPQFQDDLFEEIEVGAGPDWTDWHEEIQTPGWNFISATITTSTGQVLNPPPGPNIWVNFEPALPAGTTISIQKILEYTGPTIIGPSVIELWEYPTIPEQGLIGGETLSVDATALILAGAQSNALALLGGLSVLGAAVFGAIFLLNRRK